jgi:hypothetical protein
VPDHRGAEAVVTSAPFAFAGVPPNAAIDLICARTFLDALVQTGGVEVKRAVERNAISANWAVARGRVETIAEAIEELMQTSIEDPSAKMQSEAYSGPITRTSYQRFQWIRRQPQRERVKIPLPTGN